MATRARSEKPRAIGCFIFAGGFSLGVGRHFILTTHLEHGNYGVATSRRNLGIEAWTDPEKWPTAEFEGIDLVYANPPCAPWSAAGSKVKGGARDYSAGVDPRDQRAACLHRVFGLLSSIRPKILVTESVTRLWTAGRPLVEQMARSASESGYRTSVVLLDGFDCGVPQHRRRVFVVFHRRDVAWSRPAVRGPRTVREALEGLEDPRPEIPRMWREEAECLAVAPQGAKLRRIYDEIAREKGWRPPKGRPGFLRRRLEWDEASPTHTGGDVLYHPTIDRKISVREAQVLCGYPEDYEFVCGGIGTKFKQIAQAVMPPVGRWLGGVLAESLERNACARGHLGEIAVHDFTKKVER